MLLEMALLEALERMPCGGIILNSTGKVTHLNAAAEQFLRKYASLGPSATRPSDWTRALRPLIGARQDHMAGDPDLWVPVADVGAPKLVLYSRRLANGDEGALTIITLVDLTEPAQLCGETLQKLFGLTPEARLACEIARGAGPSEAAAALGIKMLTARSQLASILAKTGTQRQGALVALLARLAVLPTVRSSAENRPGQFHL